MKVRLSVTENITYVSEIEVELPKGMDEYDFYPIVNKVAGDCKYDDAKNIAFILETKHGFKTTMVKNGFPDSPEDSYLELTDVDIIEE